MTTKWATFKPMHSKVMGPSWDMCTPDPPYHWTLTYVDLWEDTLNWNWYNGFCKDWSCVALVLYTPWNQTSPSPSFTALFSCVQAVLRESRELHGDLESMGEKVELLSEVLQVEAMSQQVCELSRHTEELQQSIKTRLQSLQDADKVQWYWFLPLRSYLQYQCVSGKPYFHYKQPAEFPWRNIKTYLVDCTQLEVSLSGMMHLCWAFLIAFFVCLFKKQQTCPLSWLMFFLIVCHI